MGDIAKRVMPAGPQFLDFRADQEPWTQYTLENGVVVRVRVMLAKVIDSGEFGPDGFPLYQMQFQQVLDVTWPADVEQEAAARRDGG